MKEIDLLLSNQLAGAVLRYGQTELMNIAVGCRNHDLSAKIVATVCQRDVGVMFDKWVYNPEIGVPVDGKTYMEFLRMKSAERREDMHK